MHRLATTALCTAVLALMSVALVGCDTGASSVQDIDIQPDLEIPGSVAIIVTEDAGSSSEFTVEYQGLESVPTLSSSFENFSLEKIGETGGPNEGGEQSWRATYEQGTSQSIEGTVTLSATTTTGDEITRDIAVAVVSIGIEDPFEQNNGFAAVADYEDEQREINTTGGTSTEMTDAVAASSNGVNALEIDASGSGSTVINRVASAPGADRFTFLIKPDASTSFGLTLTFSERTGDGTVNREFEIPVTPGNDWRKYIIEFDKISSDFNPVASRAGGNGPLESITFAADADVTYSIDELLLEGGGAIPVEIDDFERTTNAYASGDLNPANSDNVADPADGPTSRSFSYTTGGNFFGYNYSRLRVEATAEDVLSLRVGNVSRDFNLYVFIETADGNAGGYSFGNGIEVPIEAGSGWRTIEVPVGDVGDDPSALLDPGITNVGFEARRPSSDSTTEPIEFLMDDIKLRQASSN